MFLHKTSRMLHPVCPGVLKDVNKCFCDPKNKQLHGPVCPKLGDRSNACYCGPDNSYETKKQSKQKKTMQSKIPRKKNKYDGPKERCTGRNEWALVKITTNNDGTREFEILEVYKSPPGKYDRKLFNGKSSIRISNNQVVWALAKVTTECDDTKVFEILEVSNDPPDRYMCKRGSFVV